MRPLLTLLAIVALSALVASGVRLNRANAEHTVLRRQLEIASEENDRLRALVAVGEKKQLLERTRALRTEIEHQVESLRGLKFLEPVVYAAVSRQEIRSIFAKALAEDTSEADFVNISRAWVRLGLLPKPLPLRETLLDLFSEQVAAFYNHHEHKLFMFEDSSLEKPYDRVILAHELTHALQDQHFHLVSLPISLKDNDDRALAALAVIEGDATAVMTDYMAANISLRTVLDAATSVMSQQMVQLQKSPRYLRERLVFPYMQGKTFCTDVLELRGRSGLDACFTRVPSSTTQILHAEKYLAARTEEPLSVTWPDTKFEGHAPAADNVAGEAGIQSLMMEWLGESLAEPAAAGWRGDRYLSYEDDTLVWKTLWSDDLEAREFFEAERELLAKRYGPALPRSSEERLEIDTPRVVRLIRNLPENSVTLIDTASAELAEKAEAQFAK